MPEIDKLIEQAGALTLAAVPEGYDAQILADMARLHKGRILHIARDARRLEDMRQALAFFAPDIPVLIIPAWDCLPYDRLSPQTALMAARLASLAQIPAWQGQAHIILTSVSAASQHIIPREALAHITFMARPGQNIDEAALLDFLTRNGYSRCATVMEAGDFAFRGNLIDLFPPGAAHPLRLDLFGDVLESIRSFDVETQRSIAQQNELLFRPASEVLIDEDTVTRFRRHYARQFGGRATQDYLYEQISQNRRVQGMEHYLPLFYDTMETLFEHIGDAAMICLDHQFSDTLAERETQIEDYYQARLAAHEANPQEARPLPPEQLYLSHAQFYERLAAHKVRQFTPFGQEENQTTIHMGAKQGRDFVKERTNNENVFDALIGHIAGLQKPVFIMCRSEGTRSRLADLLQDHGFDDFICEDEWQISHPQKTILAVLSLERGFETEHTVFISEQDILGARMVRTRRKKTAENFLTETSSLAPGDYVVHIEHGIGRFENLETINVGGAAHDCLKLVYHDNARLFLPVENIDLLSRYGGDDMSVQLDRLGGAAWQARKARLKKKLLDIADGLIAIAAARVLRDAPRLQPMTGLYDEFCAKFPFEETEDQFNAIEAVIDDMASGKPMDRLVCGDVGFGKTEVALRAAFIAALSGQQVAFIAPTTLLVRQHVETFRARFADMPVRIAELSRLVKPADAKQTKQQIKDGTVDIIIGTHALLAKDITFKNLGLLIIDEEQHFGVIHKERLKEFRADVHVLTLTATPIPRTLQMALTGVRELSIIATPPIDRLAIRSYISPFDMVTIREALLREKYRSGQSFFIVPRIADLDDIVAFLEEHVPEVTFIVAHGQLSGRDLENRMMAFYHGEADVLLSTSIVESGLDIPRANTIIIHRADMFGLAQLYQMRGRVGRSKLRAYAYLTYATDKPLTPAAEKRLEILQSLDNLGAGFTLANHDLDLRGAGNLVGEEQSGHIREVGFELYQSMLEEAIANRQGTNTDENWSPQINLGSAVMIPEDYIPDLEIRMGLYRRLAHIDNQQIDAFAAELIDRFGALPPPLQHLLQVIEIKNLCYQAGVEKIDAGAKGALVQFRKNQFANPQGLISYLEKHARAAKLRPDHMLVLKAKWEDEKTRMAGVKALAHELVEITTGC